MSMSHSPCSDPPDALFFERLETFLEKSLKEVQAFSERECRSFEETRTYVAEWHCKYLFEMSPSVEDGTRSLAVLKNAAQSLESLHRISSVHSFVVAVLPPSGSTSNSSSFSNSYFIGGTPVGCEFWKNLRGGGEAGIKAFKRYCTTNTASDAAAKVSMMIGMKKDRDGMTASALKTELYSSVRNALRTSSGLSTAEMKWSNHSRLSTYGVTLVGWPADIPMQNPSALSVNNLRTLLEELDDGKIKFMKDNKGHEPERSLMEAEDLNRSWPCENVREMETSHSLEVGPESEPLEHRMVYLISGVPSSPPSPVREPLQQETFAVDWHIDTNHKSKKRKRDEPDEDAINGEGSVAQLL